jgi:hypothetical protein
MVDDYDVLFSVMLRRNVKVRDWSDCVNLNFLTVVSDGELDGISDRAGVTILKAGFAEEIKGLLL